MKKLVSTKHNVSLLRLHRQGGVALVLAMFIVALVTAVVVSVSWRYKLSMARNENRWHGSQAELYLGGAEQLAAMLLQFDATQGQIDSPMDAWAEEHPPFPTDEGWLRGTIEDAHGRINLNMLLPPTRQPNGNNNNTGSENGNQEELPRWSAPQRRFIRLLQLMELESGFLDQGAATEIAEAVQDWIDADSTPSGFGGAELNYYQGLEHPYLIANKEMQTVSELSLVKGVTPELYKQLLPYVIALPGAQVPENERVGMNINTMKPLLVRTLNRSNMLTPMDEGDWEAYIEERSLAIEPYESIEAFKSSQFSQTILGSGNEFEAEGLTVSSNYFLVFAETLVGEQTRRGKSVLYRNTAGQVSVIRRTDANF